MTKDQLVDLTKFESSATKGLRESMKELANDLLDLTETDVSFYRSQEMSLPYDDNGNDIKVIFWHTELSDKGDPTGKNVKPNY